MDTSEEMEIGATMPRCFKRSSETKNLCATLGQSLKLPGGHCA